MRDPVSLPRIVALKYEPADGAPRVILKASGELAAQVLHARRHAAHAAPVVRNEALLEQLYRLPVDGEIGAELYRAVAIVIAHVLSVETRLKGAHDAVPR
jgi:type III secretion system FlhB-like substrate exporter